MINIKGKSADELFIKIAKQMKKEGISVAPRGLKTIELQNICLTLTNPEKCIVELPERKLDKKYLQAELDWYMSGDLSIKNIKEHSSFWKTIANPDDTINSNYGYFVFKQLTPEKISQYEWCLLKLKEDKNSRQAIINYNQLNHKYKNNKDFVCTIAQSFRINNNKLDSIVIMRSNDLIYGLSYDMPWFCLIQKKLANDLGIKIGIYNHIDLSLHVYEKHFKMLNNIAKVKI